MSLLLAFLANLKGAASRTPPFAGVFLRGTTFCEFEGKPRGNPPQRKTHTHTHRFRPPVKPLCPAPGSCNHCCPGARPGKAVKLQGVHVVGCYRRALPLGANVGLRGCDSACLCVCVSLSLSLFLKGANCGHIELKLRGSKPKVPMRSIQYGLWFWRVPF